jgi:hypothetical protein
MSTGGHEQLGLGRTVVSGEDGPPGDLPSETRCAARGYDRGYDRMQPVGTDDQICGEGCAIRRDDGGCGPLVYANHLLPQPDFDTGRTCGLCQHINQVRTMKKEVVVRPRQSRIGEPGQQTALPIPENKRLRNRGASGPNSTLKSQGAKNGKTVGADLQSGPDLGYLGCLFQQCDLGPAQGQRKSGRQTADPGPDDHDIPVEK